DGEWAVQLDPLHRIGAVLAQVRLSQHAIRGRGQLRVGRGGGGKSKGHDSPYMRARSQASSASHSETQTGLKDRHAGKCEIIFRRGAEIARPENGNSEAGHLADSMIFRRPQSNLSKLQGTLAAFSGPTRLTVEPVGVFRASVAKASAPEKRPHGL